MSILDDILNKNKNKVANSFIPVDEQNLEGPANNTPVIADSTKIGTRQDNVQSEQSVAQPEVKYPNKPQALNDGEYEHLLKYRSPEDITKFSAPFDPNSGEDIFQRYYESTIPKPTAPDEKKTRNAQLIASIADGVGLLSQMYTYGKGSHVEKRDYRNSALSQVNADAKDAHNRYLQLSQRYNDGLLQARIKDFQNALDDYNNGRKAIQSILDAKHKQDQTGEQFKEKQRYAYDKLAQDQANKDKDYELRKQNTESQIAQRNAYIKQGLARVTDSHNRTSAYVKNISSGGKNGYQMIFLANQNDKNARTDEFGNSVVEFNMTKGQIDQYAREALSDSQFMARHPELVTQKPDILGNGQIKYKPVQDIAAAYLQERYEKQFDPEPSVQTSMPMIYWSSLMNQGIPDWNQMLNGNTSQTEEEDEWGQFEISGF